VSGVTLAAANAEALVAVDGLGVRFGTRWAVRQLGFRVHAGEIVGLLGPNGAGKTTTMNVLAALRRPDEGSTRVAGHDVLNATPALRRSIGLVPQSLALYPTLTAWENVSFFGTAAGLRGATARDAARRVLDIVGLDERRDDRVDTFSGGMRRRLNLACGMLHRPPVLLLDEATVGVDPQSRERIYAAVREQARAGSAVLWSTHAIDEAERCCDRVVLIDGGHVVAEGTPEALVKRARAGLRLVASTARALPESWSRDLAGIELDPEPAPAREDEAEVARVRLRAADAACAARAIERIAVTGAGLVGFELREPGLEDVFLELTGRDLRD
jgi:ABC-2 type transport system ATP-binding protein